VFTYRPRLVLLHRPSSTERRAHRFRARDHPVSEHKTNCQVHVFDRDTEVYHRQLCPDVLATERERARPQFSPEADQVLWFLPGEGELLRLANPLLP
jgi:hypothetical protein